MQIKVGDSEFPQFLEETKVKVQAVIWNDDNNYELPPVKNSADIVYDIKALELPEFASYERPDELFKLKPLYSDIGKHKAVMSWDADDRTYTGSYFGSPYELLDVSTFNQNFTVDIEVVDDSKEGITFKQYQAIDEDGIGII